MSSDHVRAARRMSVAKCVDRLAIGPLLVRPDDDLLDIARRVAAQPSTRVIGVVDEGERLVGILPVYRVVEDVIARVDPEALMSGITDIEDVARFSHAIEARTARDAMLPPVSVAATATVGEAFRILRDQRLSGIHVVDGERRIVGYMDLLELAVLYVDVLEAANAPGRPADGPSSSSPGFRG